ncbi:MAG: hypothetical protein AAGA48_05195 [Myxococcota bacterium]
MLESSRFSTAVLLVCALVTSVLLFGIPRLETRLDLLALYAQSSGGTALAPSLLVALPDPARPDVVEEARKQVAAVAGVDQVEALAVPEGLAPFVAEQMATAMWGQADARPAVLRTTLTRSDPATVKSLEAAAAAHNGALLGLPVLDEAHRKLVSSAVAWSLAVVALTFFGILTVLWRRPYAALVPIGAVAVGVVWFLGLVGWAGVPLGGPMLALIPLIAVLGLTDAIHVAWRLAEPGPDPWRTLITVARACTWTSVTTGVGLLALLVTDSTLLHRFGMWGALGMALVLVTGVGLPAAILLRFPWLAPRPRTLLVGPMPAVSAGVARWGTVGLLVVLGALASGLQVDLIPGNDLPADHPISVRHTENDAALGGLHPLRVHVRPLGGQTDDPDAFLSLVALQRAAVNHPAVGSVVSFADAVLITGKAGRRTIEQLAGRPGARGPGRTRRYQRVRDRAREASKELTALELDDGETWTMHLRLHHVGASQWSDLLEALSRTAAGHATLTFEGYPPLVVQTRAGLPRDAGAVFGLAGGVALICLVLLTRRTAALVALPLVGVTGLAVLAGLAVTMVPLSHANLFALSVAIGVALDPWIHLVMARGESSGPPVVVGQSLIVVGLALLGTSEVTTLAQTGPVLAGAVMLNGVVTALWWLSGTTRGAVP